jgi:membrane protease YdiL (CAAX protease family)
LGLSLGGLTLATGNLGAAVAAHFIINALNLAYITGRPSSVMSYRAN